jgi:hypothetical protein
VKKFVLLAPLLLAFAFGQNLLTNGDFEQDLSVGWIWSGSGYTAAVRDPGCQPDPDYEVMDSLYAYGFGRLSQTVDAPGTSLILSFQASFAIGAGSSSCWPVASVAVGYLDASDNVLGETRIYLHNSYCTWTPTGTLSLIEVTDTNWTDYTLDIAQELGEHLPGVNPGDISKISVAVWDTTSGG